MAPNTPADTGGPPGPPQPIRLSPEEYTRVSQTPEFRELRQRYRNFVFPTTVAFLVWYLTYVLLSMYAVDFMATPVFGNINLGILLGFAQFFTTFLITWLYIRHANNKLDPISDEIRHQMEEGDL